MNRPIILPKNNHTPKKLIGQLFYIVILMMITYGGFFFWKLSQIPLYPKGSPNSLLYCYQYSSTGMITNWDCIKKTTETILEHTSTRDLMDFLTKADTPELIRNNCHAIAHNIGAETFNQSSSMESALAKCSNTCGAGCIHGAIGAAVLKDLGEPYSSENIEHASLATIEKMGKKYCDHGNPMCHAVGHILYIATNSYTGALQSCEKVSTGELKESCYNGVFMQGVGGENEGLFSDQPSPHITISDMSYPCSGVQQDQLHACFHYLPLVQNQSFKFKNLHDSTMREHISNEVCEKFPMPGRADCFEGIGFFVDNTVFSDEVPVNIDKRCESPHTLNDRKACTRGIVGYYMYRFEYDPLITFCEKITETSRKNTCYDTMFDSMNDEDNPKEICKAHNSISCLEAYSRYIKENI